MQGYFLIVGVLCAVGGVALLWKRVWFFVQSKRAEGVITGYVERRDDDGAMRLHGAIVHFTTAEWRDIEFQAFYGNALHKPPLKYQVTVIYRADRPEEAYILGFVSYWLAPISLLVLGCVGMFCGLK
jgi:hypothetical protein